ncbi:DNA-binding protein [Psychromarinibacter halotolerans]|uniref:DNA-binding protein n=1 Tax=Psychromarinibacter halotolerans TaxID=1775175 RepID=A0ABV7GPL3_9RHOB|nr:DNA-binding protein [Psychromarinibacter halotolerans]MDF0594621.1 DNA-binding protein [Psychromarinibacter halotolerans]
MAQKKNNTSLEKQVRDAIQQLTADGKPVTNQAVRDLLGGGSFRDISPKVKQITAEIAAKEQAARAAPEMPEDFRDAAAAMWQMSWELADEIAASDRRAHAVELERLKGEVDEALANCALVEDERDDAEMRVQDLEKRLDEAQATLHDAQLEIARLNGRLMEREKDIVSRVKRTKAPRKTKNPTDDADDTPPATEENVDNQLDMFPNDKLGEKKHGDPEPIAAE